MRVMVPYRGGRQSDSSLTNLVQTMNQMFSDDVFGGFMAVPFRGWDSAAFRADVRENEQEYLIEAELPGFKKEEIAIELHEKHLTVQAEKKTEENEEQPNYLRRERRQTSLSRSFALDGIDPAKVTASYQDGILRLTLPKLTPTGQNRKIEIQ